MTACFWADRPLDPGGQSADDNGGDADDDTGEPDDDNPRPHCPRCETPVLVVTCRGPAEHVATPCGCRVPGDLLEFEAD